MKNGVPVSKIMTKNLVTLSPTDDLVAAERLFKKHHIRHIPVVEGNAIKGMLSYTDLLRISFADAIDEHEEYVDTIVYNMFTIPQVMVHDVVTVTSGSSIKEVAEILSKREFHALPVVDDGKLKGIVTTTDLIRYFLKSIF
ncbi:MAG: CBS domain-containing protein [Bacteroidota bacterium]|uniref:CBS domain-containing protein n=1 Tax=Flagellimonas okinawensis TaxID=3031324 RepID=A0ABT5XKF1_9FLAO|nr:CBS domain-containing protein [[Muricauda] okinawensis]MDF0706365.1 CBS domain-containing protein [[Muricauda] okinawensis]MEC8831553.1 CBS domain-containing protein [Bacteroidota bacterium]